MDDEQWGTDTWPLGRRHRSLPKWAQQEIRKYRLSEIDDEMDACIRLDIRDLCKTATGINCTFADSDLHLMALLASRAVDAGLIDGIGDGQAQRRMKRAAGRRRAAQRIEAGTDETAKLDQPEGREPDPEGDAPE